MAVNLLLRKWLKCVGNGEADCQQVTANENQIKMKKTILLGFLLAIVSIVATGCSSCQSENKKQDGIELLKLGANRVISTQRQGVYLNTPKGYELKWMQTEATWTAFLTDDAAADATLMEVTSGFQTQWKVNERASDTKVTIVSTNTMTTDSLVLEHSFYFDNYPLNDKPINLSFEDARQKVLNANCPKPQTRLCVLRSPVGSVHVEDAYYIFGDGQPNTPMIYVNARTGEVTTSNPAFTKPTEENQQ